MVRLDRTFSDYSFTGARSAKCTSSMRFKHIEPHRTFSNYILTERGRYLAFFYMSSALFDWTEPSLTASLQGIEGMQGAKCTSWRRFKHSEPQRTFSNCSLTERARYIDFFHSSSGWFDCTEPSPTTSLQVTMPAYTWGICTGGVVCACITCNPPSVSSTCTCMST